MAPSSSPFPQPGGLLGVAGYSSFLGKSRKKVMALLLQLRRPRMALAIGGGQKSLGRERVKYRDGCSLAQPCPDTGCTSLRVCVAY